MTISPVDLFFYLGALVVLFLTPGPVWVAITARSLSGGFAGAWPLAAGVALGDALWPLAAIFGLSWIVSLYGGVLVAMKWVAAAIFLVMGWALIRNADRQLSADSRLAKPGLWPGFSAGVAVIVGNPKAILFYMGVLPGFFDLSAVGAPDIAAIVLVSMAVPLVGNVGFALFIDRLRRLLTTPAALRRVNLTAGVLLVLVGLVIPFT